MIEPMRDLSRQLRGAGPPSGRGSLSAGHAVAPTTYFKPVTRVRGLNRLNARRLRDTHGNGVRALVNRVALIEMALPVLTRARTMTAPTVWGPTPDLIGWQVDVHDGSTNGGNTRHRHRPKLATSVGYTVRPRIAGFYFTVKL